MSRTSTSATILAQWRITGATLQVSGGGLDEVERPV
jgi:hypothetical protein